MKVLIDPGHGIDTPGKRSPDGKFREYLWNRQVADLLGAKLIAMGFDASPVVTETNDISLSTRVQRVNKVCTQVGISNVILVSIHANAAGNGSKWMNGTAYESYTTPGETKSDELAECLYQAFAAAFPDKKMRKDMSDGDSDKESQFYIISKTKCPAVLLENFFYDNLEECTWLLQEETKERIADAAALGIARYLGK